ncbi:hypothetical protein M3P05_12460 [Sansalvadorimonas sp. 2012CJ34-2]|uniref:Uncharacterized protein n=1 Tax=Parendozoicomonas callyspongiae TaxID=2942213 RepID=A0ABT0PH83_9GAMM|nr:hypothetical protein [Sansalvadorimonas sp. 2012CJ34-2]MCL6270737.1 hypothetical protein [Sansalvadorimonas sp. 2012CJ34-2]
MSEAVQTSVAETSPQPSSLASSDDDLAKAEPVIAEVTEQPVKQEITVSPEQAFYQEQLESLKKQLAELEQSKSTDQLIQEGDALLRQLEQLNDSVSQEEPAENTPAQQELHNQIQSLEQRIQSLN